MPDENVFARIRRRRPHNSTHQVYIHSNMNAAPTDDMDVLDARIKILSELDALLKQKSALQAKKDLENAKRQDVKTRIALPTNETSGNADDGGGDASSLDDEEEDESDSEYVFYSETKKKKKKKKKKEPLKKVCTLCGREDGKAVQKQIMGRRLNVTTRFSPGHDKCDVCVFGFIRCYDGKYKDEPKFTELRNKQEDKDRNNDGPNRGPNRETSKKQTRHSPRKKKKPTRFVDDDEDMEIAKSPLKPAATAQQKKKSQKSDQESTILSTYACLVGAACEGDIEALERNLSDITFSWYSRLVCQVACHGVFPTRVIQYLLDKGARIDAGTGDHVVERVRCPACEAPDGTYESALDVLKFLYRIKPAVVTENTLYQACFYGELDCVRWMIETVPGLDVAEWPSNHTPDGHCNVLMVAAAQNSHLHVFKYLYDANCDFSVEDAEDAVKFAFERRQRRWCDVVKFIKTTDEWKRITA